MHKMDLIGAAKSLVFGCCLLLVSFVSALAEDVSNDVLESNIAMPELVVTATRDMRAVVDTPFSIDILSADKLTIETPVRTVPEALKNEPGVMVQKTGHGQGSPYIRGFTGYRNLFMIDGIRLNNSVFRDGPNQYWNTIDPFSLHGLELVRGPFSVLYGSDAIGGTVNAITRGVQDLRTDRNWDRRLYYRYSSAENSQIVRAESIARPTDNLALTFGYSYKDFGDVEGGKDVGTQEKTGYDERDWDIKLEYFINDDAFVVLAHQSVDVDDAWRTHKTIYGSDWEGLSVGKELRRTLDQNRDLTYLQYHQFNANGFAEEIHAGISRQSQSESRDRLRTQDRHDVQGFDVESLGAFISLKSPTPIGSLVYGGDYYHDEVSSFKNTLDSDGAVTSSSIQGPVGDDAEYDVLGLYLQDEIYVTERLLFIIGARYEFAQADADSVQNPVTGEKMQVADDWDEIIGSARILYYLDEGKLWNVFGGVSQGYRAPNLSDLTRFDSARTDEYESPSPDLDPEYFVSYEVGIKAETESFGAQLSYFYTDIDGMIVRTPTGNIIDGEYEITKKNGGDGYVQGLELDARYCFLDDFTAFGAFTWMDGRVETYPSSEDVLVREYIDRLMPPTGRVGLRWDLNKQFWLEGSCQMAAKADKLSTRDMSDTSRIPPGGTPGYTTFDIRAGWNCSDELAFSVSIENIADEDYRIHGSGLNEPGRNLVVAVDLTF